MVTILFADLAGSTSLGERLDPEDVRDLQSTLFGLINDEVERFGGLTEKFVGDAVLAVFGIPRVHEDDAERAVRAALATQARFGEFAQRVQARFGGEVGLRIGVNTGEVVSGREAAARGELMVSGDAVNVAARLQQAARPGEVLVGERTRVATSRAIRYQRAEAVAAKGKAERLATARAIAPVDTAPPRGTAAFAAPLVGRQDELAILAALARRVEREHAPQLVTLYGPAGVGKSRLLAEFLERLPEVAVLRGRCLPYGDGITYWPFVEAVKAQAGVFETDSAAAAAEKLRRTVSDVVPSAEDSVLTPILWTIGLALPTDGASGEGVAATLHEAWRVYLAQLGRRRPTVVVVEDIHWASAPMLDLLERLADSLADTSILIACTARTELLELRPSWGAAKQNATALTLAPLGSEQSSELVEALLGQKATAAVRNGILARAEGNPFFVEEMLRMLIETGELVNGAAGWKLTFAQARLPDSVHGVIAARLDLLDADERDALRRCSVVGRFFWPAAVGVPDEIVSALGARGLVAEKASTMAETKEFAFKHALTRDVAYTSLPRPERRALHTRVADWLEDVAPDRGVENAELVAYHYGEAVAYGGDDEVVRRAASLFVIAGEAALSVAHSRSRASTSSAPRPCAEPTRPRQKRSSVWRGSR